MCEPPDEAQAQTHGREAAQVQRVQLRVRLPVGHDEAQAHSHGRDAVRVHRGRLQPRVQRCEQPVEAPPVRAQAGCCGCCCGLRACGVGYWPPPGREVAQVRPVQLHEPLGEPPDEAQAHSQGREAVQVHRGRLQLRVQHHQCVDEAPPAHSPGREAVRVHRLQPRVQPGGQPVEAPPGGAQPGRSRVRLLQGEPQQAQFALRQGDGAGGERVPRVPQQGHGQEQAHRAAVVRVHGQGAGNELSGRL
mmetsp:Transcript_7673/g.23425  ORF Transcript_7673/g.23425 Transcript_7673/m.23425 type:complete len:247 (+) Transcript_7673:735-1475(+)